MGPLAQSQRFKEHEKPMYHNLLPIQPLQSSRVPIHMPTRYILTLNVANLQEGEVVVSSNQSKK